MRDRESQNRYGPDFNRRQFLQGTSVAVATSALATAAQDALAQEKAAEAAASSTARAIELTVNGETHKLTLEPRVTLLDALRNDLNLTGCKEVCTSKNCGACTVIIDGKAVYACTRLAVAEEGKKISTVESLPCEPGKCDPVIEGFVKHDASQCGYCTPGFVMATKAFIAAHPEASLEDIRKGLGGNICRCGTYEGITQCALELAKKGGQ